MSADYFREACTVLSEFPDSLIRFDALWAEGRFREAYRQVYEVMAAQAGKPSRGYQEADRAFYWTYVA